MPESLSKHRKYFFDDMNDLSAADNWSPIKLRGAPSDSLAYIRPKSPLTYAFPKLTGAC